MGMEVLSNEEMLQVNGGWSWTDSLTMGFHVAAILVFPEVTLPVIAVWAAVDAYHFATSY